MSPQPDADRAAGRVVVADQAVVAAVAKQRYGCMQTGSIIRGHSPRIFFGGSFPTQQETFMFKLVLAVLIPFALIGTAQAADPAPIVRYSAKASFENARDDLVNAITGQGLVIDHNSHVANMLDRTGKDLGHTKRMYGNDQAQSFSFCSATVSRKTMEADPHNIAFCPYTITLYSLLSEPGTVYVAYRRPLRHDNTPASAASLKDVEKLLDTIAREALNLPAK